MNSSIRTLSKISEMDNYNSRLYRLIAPHVKRGRIIEIGCGTGNIAALFGGRDFTGIDPDGQAIRVARRRFRSEKNFRFVHAGIEDARRKLGGRKFDTVICMNVLEHVRDDVHGLEEMATLLQRGGTLVLLVPANQWAYNDLDRNMKHFRRYSKGELAEKLSAAGFETKSLESTNPFGLLGWVISGTIMRDKELKSGKLMFFDRFLWLFEKIGKPFEKFAGLSIIAICRKKE